MTFKLFVALYVGLIVGMIILFVTNFPVAWIFFSFLFVTAFGGILLINRPYLIVAIFLLASLIVLGIGLFGIRQSSQISAWPTAPGVITDSWFCTQTVNGDVVYSGPCIEYRYRVDGQTFQASSIDTGEFAQRWWSRIPDIYAEGREVKVYYNPNNPGLSRLSAGILPRDWVTTMVGAIMAALSTFTLCWVLLNRKETPPNIAPVNVPEEQTAHPDRQARPPRGSQKSTIPDIADQLEKLAALHQQQAITDEEYELAKKRLLGL
ncbi:MAG: DUF3592 domain-containing protein [Anaerolineae bacterium]|nr:DUF3592 domain-containing protein [Anaerolineae bacterium]